MAAWALSVGCRVDRRLAQRLGSAGVVLRLTDRLALPDALPPGASFTAPDLADPRSVAELALDCGAILHFGGVPSVELAERLQGGVFCGLGREGA